MAVRQRRTPPPELPATLRAARGRAGLTLKALGELARVTPSYLCHLESGERCPSRTVAGRLADALGLVGEERAALLDGAVDDAGLNHPWRRSFSTNSPLFEGRRSVS
ncbi:helix-turn-helix transcriptional regulator [Streptomyces sp. NPDC001315]|uniref:helix-turn-helix transcriptional regulator n=1 Tax=Streptomyces sp. NPDC001315 TaxID=3364562 RepID=UPI0036B9474A